MTPKEKKEAASKVLDDTMTVSQARKRKLELRDKDLNIRAASLKRKQANDADARKRRAKASEDKAQKEKDARSDKKASEVVAAIKKRKERKAAAEKGKADKLKGIADKRKAGVKKSVDRAKEVSKGMQSKSIIRKDEGEASAELKVAKDAAKAGVAAGRGALNLGKAAAKGVGAAIAGIRAKRAQGKIDAKDRKIEKRNEKLDKAHDDKVRERLNRRKKSKAEASKKEEPKKEAPKAEAPKKEEPKKDSPTKSASKETKKETKKPEDPWKGESSKKSEVKKVKVKVVEPKKIEGSKEVEKVKVKVEEPKKESGSKRRALKAAAGKVAGKTKDLAKKAAANPKVREAAKSAAKAGVKYVAKRAAGKVAPPTRKALPSGQKALPPAGGVNKPKPQAKSSEGSGNMSDAQRARKDPAYRKKLIQQRNQGMNEEFYEYLMEIERMEKKTDKVINIMKGKNKIEISPKISEELTGGILIQDAEDYTPLEIETVDVIEADPIKEGIASTITRAGIKVGGKKGGRAVQAGGRAAAKKGKDVVAKTKEGNKKKMVGDGKYEKMGAKVGGVGGAAAGFLVPDGPAMVAGEIAGGIAGAKVGGKIGRQIDKFRAKKAKKKDEVKEEASDAMKDRRMERGGVGGNQRYNKPISNTPNTFGKKKPKKGGPSAMDIVRADIEKKYGKGAIMDTKKTKKEGFSDWRSDLLVEAPAKVPLKDTGNPVQNAWNKFVPPPESSANPNVRSGLRKPGKLEAPLLKRANDTAKAVNKPIKAAGQATKGLRAAGDFIKNNPGKSALIGAGVVGAGVLAAKALGGGKKKEKNEHLDWRSELNYVEEEGKKDACYKKVKASAKVWPSAYASGRLVQCRKKGADNYGNSKKD